MSAKTGVAPTSATTSAVEMNEKSGTMTSSSGPTPSARSASAKASVPFPQPTTWPPRFEAVVESVLKCLDVLATDERRLGEHLVNGLVQFGTKACVQSPQIHHVDGFVLRAGSRLRRGVGRDVGHRRKAKIARTLGP